MGDNEAFVEVPTRGCMGLVLRKSKEEVTSNEIPFCDLFERIVVLLMTAHEALQKVHSMLLSYVCR